MVFFACFLFVVLFFKSSRGVEAGTMIASTRI